MQDDLQFAILHLLQPEGVFYLYFGAIRFGKVVVAHSESHVAADYRAFVFPADIRIRRDRKTAVFFNAAADEIGQGFIEGAPKLVFAGQRRLEQNPSFAIGVELLDVLFGCGFVVAACGMDGMDPILTIPLPHAVLNSVTLSAVSAGALVAWAAPVMANVATVAERMAVFST